MNNQITAKVVQDSVSHSGIRITTLELEYPRWVHAEFMTHRMFSRNAASSRAIPVAKTAKQVMFSHAMPTYWGANQKGMQSTSELTGVRLTLAKGLWRVGAFMAGLQSLLLSKVGLHKQYANRLNEYAQLYKVVVTATEWDNFFRLRDHEDAQPEIRALAQAIKGAMRESTPMQLNVGEWHVPYVRRVRHYNDRLTYVSPNDCCYDTIDLENAIAISASCCAQVSYRALDTSLDKAKSIYDKLIHSKPMHASPMEHQATPMKTLIDASSLGVTHQDCTTGESWSGNFRGFIQNRQLIEDENE